MLKKDFIMSLFNSSAIRLCIVSAFCLTAHSVFAEGMVPETSLLVIDEATHTGTMNVKNTDAHPALLYTAIIDLPDESEDIKIMPTQPVIRVEPGQTQQIRFILQNNTPLEVEHFKRVTFEGIPPKNNDKRIKIGFNIRQDLPVLIRPANLAVVTDAWNYLQWSAKGNEGKVVNPSKYVVRLARDMIFLPSEATGYINKSYILPGETLKITISKNIVSDNKVKFFPASRYGVEVPSFITELNER
ncbi:TPA: fimbria/pilus chaperone family protein [Klebsiella michiganensis]